MNLTHEYLKKLLSYDKETGLFFWNISKGTIKAGKKAGFKQSKGYIQISIDNKQYFAHRLAWLYIHGAWPINLIDHIDQNKENNKIENLRDVTKEINFQNQSKSHSNNKTNLLGVHYKKSIDKYAARIKSNGKDYFLGYFDNPEDASTRYFEAKSVYHTY